MTDPITGPLTREQLKELAAAPFGKATEEIRQYDPQWGRAEDEKFEWTVTVVRTGTDEGKAYIMANSQDEADALADELTESEIDWDFDSSDGIMVISVEPSRVRK